MRPWTTWSAWLLSSAFLGSCQAAGIADMAKMMPPCATPCVFNALSHTSCTVTDVDCLCGDMKFQKESADCILKQCGNEDLLAMLSASSELCQFPVRDQRAKLKAIIIAFTTIASAVAAARIIYQLSPIGNGFSWDDGFIILTVALNLATGIIYVHNLIDEAGLGQDVWAITSHQLVRFINWFYVVEVIYFGAMACLKSSILFFYWRIFGQIDLAWPVIGTLIFNAVYSVIFLFVGIFQCVPIIYFWTSINYDRCFDVSAIIWSHAAISIASDFWMLALPLWRIKQLQMPWKKKAAVGLMFCTGLFVTIISIIRLKSILDFAASINPTWDQFDVALWSTVEVNVGVICACMPSMRRLIMRLIPRLADSSRNYGYSSDSRNPRKYIRSKNDDEMASDGRPKPELGTKSTAESSGDARFRPSPLIRHDSRVIVQTRDFVVDSDDEQQLVPMQDLDPMKRNDYRIPTAYDIPR